MVIEPVVFEQVLEWLLGVRCLYSGSWPLHGHPFPQSPCVQAFEGSFAHKHFEKVVAEGEEESAGTGIALATGPAAKLIVDAARFVTFRADDVKTAGRAMRTDLAAQFGKAWVDLWLPAVGAVRLGVVIGAVNAALGANHSLFFPARDAGVAVFGRAKIANAFFVNDALLKLDIRAAAGHVRGDRHVSDRLYVLSSRRLVALTGLFDDLGLTGVLLGIEHFMLDAVFARKQVG